MEKVEIPMSLYQYLIKQHTEMELLIGTKISDKVNKEFKLDIVMDAILNTSYKDRLDEAIEESEGHDL